jgi:hypothetical protein
MGNASEELKALCVNQETRRSYVFMFSLVAF